MRIHTLLFVACVSTLACSSNDDNETINPTDTGVGDSTTDGTTDGGGDTLAETLSDAQIAGVALALNQGEVDQGKVAQTKAVKKAVKDFADRMVTEHGAAVARENALGITPADSPLQAQVKSESQSIVTMLEGKSGNPFDIAYVEAQITVHTKALDTVEKVLLPAANAAVLKTELTTMRAAIQTHLAEAQTLRTSLVGDAGASDGGSSDGGGSSDAASD